MSIAQEFMDGMDEVLTTLGTSEFQLFLLDDAKTVMHDVYNESESEVYTEDPIPLSGMIKTSFKHGEEPVQGTIIDAEIKVSIKQFIAHEIDCSSDEDLRKLKRAKIIFGDFTYFVYEVKPATLVDGVWQFYKIECKVNPADILR